jgi:hypothetical protein
LAWYDPWTGEPVPDLEPENVTVGEDGGATVSAQAALASLSEAAPAFPEQSRLHRGLDVAFKFAPARPPKPEAPASPEP